MHNKTSLGILFTLASAFFYAIQAAIIKAVGTGIPLPVLVFMQSFIALLILMPIIAIQQVKTSQNLFKTKVPILQFWRTLFSLGISYFLFAALHFTPLVDAVLLANTAPFFMPFILLIYAKQKIQHRLWLPLFIGFIGVIFILKPDTQVFNPHTFIALGAGLSMALSMMLVRKISAHDSSMTVVFYYFLFSSILAGIVSVPFWQPLSVTLILILLVIGVLFFLVQYLLALGLRYTHTQNVAVLYYANVIFAALISILIFGDKSSFISITGIVLTILSAIVIIKRQAPNLQKPRL